MRDEGVQITTSIKRETPCKLVQPKLLVSSFQGLAVGQLGEDP